MSDVVKDITKIKNYELFIDYRETKSKETRNEIFKKYKYIAEIVSKRFINKGIEYDDIYQIACIGLLYAIDRYDIEKGFEFTSFATPTIIGEIKKYFRDKGWSIRVPRRIQEASKKINDAKDILVQKLQRTPKVKDLSDFLGYTEEDILEAMEASKLFSPKSLDLSLDISDEEKDVKIIDLIGTDDKYFSELENQDFVNSVLLKLNKLEKTIINERYYNNKTQAQIAKQIGISQMTVSRVEKKAIEKFKLELKRIL